MQYKCTHAITVGESMNNLEFCKALILLQHPVLLSKLSRYNLGNPSSCFCYHQAMISDLCLTGGDVKLISTRAILSLMVPIHHLSLRMNIVPLMVQWGKQRRKSARLEVAWGLWELCPCSGCYSPSPPPLWQRNKTYHLLCWGERAIQYFPRVHR